MAKRSFKQFVEQELGAVPKFFIYALLEWIMIFMLLVDGFIAFFANQFARFFELPIPCLHCTRMDDVLSGRNVDFNESICDKHKKNVSCLAFCHAHKKLSDIRSLCESCLLSFATERESDCDTYKSLLGILHKDIDQLLVEEDNEVQVSFPGGARKDEQVIFEKSNEHRCTCCGQPLKVRPTASKGKNSDEPEIKEDNDRSKGLTIQNPLKEDGKKVPEGDEEDKTPSFMKGNKFFGISLSDPATNSPRWAARTPRKLLLPKTEFASECGDPQVPNSPRMDRKSLMALYMELDEERSASAVAAYNAMAMITRLQTEKAAVQMEALQYQRMMEEQAEYDQEALQGMINLLAKREEEINVMEAELESYRQKYGRLKEGEFLVVQGNQSEKNEGIQQLLKKLPSFSSSSNARPESAAFTKAVVQNSDHVQDQPELKNSNPTVEISAVEAALNSKKAKRQMDRLKILEKKMHITTMGRFQRTHSESDDDEEEDHDEDS